MSLALVCAALLPGAVAHAAGTPPPNDDFAAAQVLSGAFGDTSGSAAFATAEPGEPSHGDPVGADDNGIPAVAYPPTGQYGGCCDNPAAHSVWFTWTAPYGGTVSFSTTGSDYDTTLSVYRPEDPAQPAAYGNLAVVAGNDDCHLGGGGISCVRFDAVGGARYWIAVDWAQQGPPDLYELRWSEAMQNDSLSSAFVVPPSMTTIVGSNTAATNGIGDPTVAGIPGGASVWYRWTPGAATVTIGTSGTCTAGFDLLLGVYTQAADGSLQPVPGGQVEIPKGQAATAAFVADGVTSYVILVEGVSNAAGIGIGTFCLQAMQTSGGNLNLDERVSSTVVHVGQPLDYTFTVGNAGPGPGLGIVVTDPLPPGTSFVSAPGCTIAGSTVSCPAARLDPGQTASFGVRVLVTAGATISNTVTVSSQNDPDPSNNSATASSTVATDPADLGIAAVSVPASGLPGGRLDYVYTVTNSGPGSARAEVDDVLPPDTTFVSGTNGCALNGTTVRCALGTLAVGASVPVSISLAVSPSSNATSISNTVTVESLDLNDINLVNNATTATTAIVQAACPAAGSVQATETWGSVHLELRGECGAYLRNAKLTVIVNGGPPLIQTSDFKQLAITGPNDALVTGVANGIPFIVNLHDDTVRIRYGLLDTGTLSVKHGEVHIRQG